MLAHLPLKTMQSWSWSLVTISRVLIGILQFLTECKTQQQMDICLWNKRKIVIFINRCSCSLKMSFFQINRLRWVKLTWCVKGFLHFTLEMIFTNFAKNNFVFVTVLNLWFRNVQAFVKNPFAILRTWRNFQLSFDINEHIFRHMIYKKVIIFP